MLPTTPWGMRGPRPAMQGASVLLGASPELPGRGRVPRLCTLCDRTTEPCGQRHRHERIPGLYLRVQRADIGQEASVSATKHAGSGLHSATCSRPAAHLRKPSEPRLAVSGGGQAGCAVLWYCGHPFAKHSSVCSTQAARDLSRCFTLMDVVVSSHNDKSTPDDKAQEVQLRAWGRGESAPIRKGAAGSPT